MQFKINRFIKAYFPDGDTNRIISALQEILNNSDEGRAYRRRILACYSRTKQAQINDEFMAAVEAVLIEYQGREQMNLFGGGGAA